MSHSDKDTSANGMAGNIIAFLQKNFRYISAGVLLLILVLVLANCTGSGQEAEPENVVTEGEAQTEEATEAAEETYQVDAYEAVNQLITQYYTAYAAGDLEAMASLAAPISDSEKSYIEMFSQYVEEYQNLTCYTKSGLESGSYLVSAYTEIKFTDVETAAPTLDFFYVRTDEYGTIYIDNLYSWFNLARNENSLDEDIRQLINDFDSEEDVLALKESVWEKYDDAIASDADLNTMFTETIPAAVQQWNAEVAAQQADTEEQIEETEQQETEAAEEQTQETESETEETSAEIETLYALERVNVRAAADASSEKLGNVEMGASVTRIGTEGEWSIIEFEGGTGYVKSEFLSTDMSSADSDSNESTAAASLAEGTVITLSSTINIRSGMSETSEKVGTAYVGEKVTVVMSYAEGWTKVTWNGKTGYILTSLLQ